MLESSRSLPDQSHDQKLSQIQILKTSDDVRHEQEIYSWPNILRSMCWVFEVIFLSPTQNLEGTNASESMVTFGIFARDILRHGFLFAEHWCVNRFFNRILVLNKIFSLTLQRVASETWAVQYILMVRIFQPFHLTFNYFLVNRWIQFLANWIRFRRSVHDHSCLDHCCGLLICQTLSGRTGKISKKH